LLAALKPKEVVDQLDKFIVGQNDAKRAVAIALRNRWRRHQLSSDLKNEVIPKNILMIGPTGCGKTEIARRIAKLSQAPFIKVEATKFTEVGFHGKDVDQIIRDLVDVSVTMTRKRLKEEMKQEVEGACEERILDMLVGQFADENQRENFRSLLREGTLNDRTIEIEVPRAGGDGKAGVGGPGGSFTYDGNNPGFIADQIFKLAKSGNGGSKRPEKKKMTIAEARPIIEDLEAERLLEDCDIPKEAIASVEENGIVFIDEIDKLVNSSDYRGADASSEGVQRDLLPLIEGSTISTKHGNVNTDFILFIASGAFHSSKPSDLLAELQGRLPIRVSLKGLSQDDLYRILTEPITNLVRQQVEMLRSEEVVLEFTDAAIREIARIAHETNRSVENIGARRLHTVIERIVEDISFEAPDRPGETITVDDDYVRERVSDMMLSSDLRKYIL
jgi:ATP-dependent HslUV protease ATP-binding subunit HslU